MPETTEVKEMLEKIEVEKELLLTMPKNNEKNISKYLDKVTELKEEYKKEQGAIEKILKKRYKKATEFETTDEVKKLEIELKEIENTLYLFSDVKTSYEKMELDKVIYKISKYYKENLENINQQIEKAIEKFAQVGINLQLSDFNYSIFVEQYMKVFFEERKKGYINSNNLKTKFEEIYWKCPDIIIHIELNLRNIYLQKQQQIDKYFEKKKNELLKKWNKKPKEIMNSYFEIKIKQAELLAQDKKRLLDEFLSGHLNIKDYAQDKLQSNYSKILSPEMIEEIETNEEEVEKSILEFLNSLYEYKNCINFKFIIDDVKKYYQEKEKYKKAYEETKKKIIDAEKKLKKLNKKISSKGLFRKKDKEIKQSTEQNQMILELKKTYKELDLNKFYNKICTNLGENPTLYDALNLANSYYNYLTNYMIENNKTITQEKIDEQIKKLDEFLKNPFNNIINNLTLADEKDIAVVIKDRYKLLNFNIKQEDLNLKNVDSLIALLENIITSFYLKKAGLKVDKIEEILQIHKLMESFE